MSGPGIFANGHAANRRFAYNGAMRVIDYFTDSLPGDLSIERQFRLLVTIFGITFLSVIVVHQFLPTTQSWWNIIVHALIVSATCLASFGVLAAVLFAVSRNLDFAAARVWHVWHVWLFSFVAYNVGYFSYLPLGENPRLAMHGSADPASSLEHYARLVPLWLLITYLFIETYLKQGFQDELEQLKRINARLGDRHEPEAAPCAATLDFTSPRKPLVLGSNAISHISVDDHYCYIFHRDDKGEWTKSDVNLPLKTILDTLPAGFLQVHRSHVVNPDFIETIERDGRNCLLTMRDGNRIPISRSKRGDVLPRLESAAGDD
ncbi:MAG: LytTR family DNA-binding domain-containing protein [Gammaproteobacteria bacterium]|nr:LytTR family DNA-binding domain-containing protein [Gammaproteobacteria bacterium]